MIKLLLEDSAEQCLSKLTFSKTKAEVSETCTCMVSTYTKLAEPYIIFDDFHAVADGTIKANIYDGGSQIGTALLVLPTYGIKSEKQLEGMCLYCGPKEKTIP